MLRLRTLLRFRLSHRHGIDSVAKFFERKGFAGAQLFSAIFAQEDGGELGGGDVESAPGGGGVFGGEADPGGGGVMERDGDEEDVALVEAGAGVFELVELREEGRVVGAGCEEEEGAVRVADFGEGGGGGWGLGLSLGGHEESECDEKPVHGGGMRGGGGLELPGGDEEEVHGPVGLEAVLPDEGGELGVVADAVHEGVDEDGAARGAEAAGGDGLEVELVVPVVGRVGEEDFDEAEGAVVGAEDLGGGAAGDFGVVGFGLGGEALGVAEFDGDDVLEEVGGGSGLADVAGEIEDFGVGGRKSNQLRAEVLFQVTRSSAGMERDMCSPGM